jgi:hypothetical protein
VYRPDIPMIRGWKVGRLISATILSLKINNEEPRIMPVIKKKKYLRK